MSTRERIDPQLLAGLDAFMAASGPRGLAGIADVGQRRAKFAEMMAAADVGAPAAGVEAQDLTAPGPPAAPGVPIRLYRPTGVSDPLAALLYIHGGGMVIGAIETEDAIARMLVAEVGCAVVSVEYRLAPEHRHPAQVEDCYAALRWCAEQADTVGIDRTRIGVYGGSAGGNLAAATAIVARDRGGPALAFQMLLYPMLDDRGQTASVQEIQDIGIWDGWAHLEGFQAMLGERAGDAVPASAAPARSQDLAGLPPTYIDVGELDALRDESIEYAERLLQAGVSTELHVYAGAYHAWEIFAPEADASKRVVADRVRVLRRALGVG